MEVKITRVNSISVVEIDGVVMDAVTDCEIKSSLSTGETELVLKFVSNIIGFETLAKKE